MIAISNAAAASNGRRVAGSFSPLPSGMWYANSADYARAAPEGHPQFLFTDYGGENWFYLRVCDPPADARVVERAHAAAKKAAAACAVAPAPKVFWFERTFNPDAGYQFVSERALRGFQMADLPDRIYIHRDLGFGTVAHVVSHEVAHIAELAWKEPQERNDHSGGFVTGFAQFICSNFFTSPDPCILCGRG